MLLNAPRPSSAPPRLSMSRRSSSSISPLRQSAILGLILIGMAVVTSVVLIRKVMMLPDSDSPHHLQQFVHKSSNLRTAHDPTSFGSSSSLHSSAVTEDSLESMESIRKRLPPSIWSTRKPFVPVDHEAVLAALTQEQRDRARSLCGKFLFSTLQRAVVMQGDRQTFVATGDIDKMWTRDSAVQMAIYLNRPKLHWLRLIMEGAIRRNAFNIIEDPYANAYERTWVDPTNLQIRDAVIGRGGWVATKNYELDSGCYFLQQLYDYYVQDDFYNPDQLLKETLIVQAVLTMVDLWIVEQHHEEKSPYRYFELPRQGLGPPSGYTGMTWTGFRPSDDPCQYGYLIPANVHAAAALERLLVINERVWKLDSLHTKVTKLLKEIEDGINKYGIVTTKDGEQVYAYEVDGLGGVSYDMDDANVPSLLSIPILGWSGYSETVYRTTRKRLLSNKNSYYYEGKALKGIGSAHTNRNSVWPMALVMQGLTAIEEDDVTKSLVFQIEQTLTSACRDAMHEGVNVDNPCVFSRPWFEWANALFVVLVETAFGESCEADAQMQVLNSTVKNLKGNPSFYVRKYNNDYKNPLFYVGVDQHVPLKFPR